MRWWWLFIVWIVHADETSILVDTFGHRGLIHDIILTDTHRLISASEDKTIRVWNTQTFQEERKILGSMGGDFGEIYAIALSHDEKTLAVGGFLAPPGEGRSGVIRLYDWRSGELRRLLIGHTNVVNDLLFDEQGFLYSASSDLSIRRWDLESNVSEVSYAHSASVCALALLHDEAHTVASVGEDGRLVLSNGLSYQASFPLRSIAVSDRRIAVAGTEKKILIFDYALNVLQTIKTQTIPIGLAFSPQGTKLIAGSTAKPCEVVIYDEEFNPIATLPHTNTVMSVGFVDEGMAITAGGGEYALRWWDVPSAELVHLIMGKGADIMHVAIDGDRIGWGNSVDVHGPNDRGVIEHALSWKSMRFTPMVDFSDPPTTQAHYACDGRGCNDALLVLPSGRTITRTSANGYRHNTFLELNGTFISGGSDGVLEAYNDQGELLTRLIGHTGEVWSVDASEEFLISGGSDQILRLWDRAEIGRVEQMVPSLSLFIDRDHEWVVWARDGTFRASPKGDRYFGYYTDHGQNRAATYQSLYNVTKLR